MTEVLSHTPPTEAMEKLNLESTDPNQPIINLNEPLTVFHDPKNFNVKHPLMNTWTLWFTKTPSATGPKEHWADLLKEVITFDSVEEFWGYISADRMFCLFDRIFNNIAKTSEIPLKSDYALFKKGVRPEWEDAANKEGGKWSYQFKRNAGIDELWLYTVPSVLNSTNDRCLLRSEKLSRRKEIMKSWVSLSMPGKASIESDCGREHVSTQKS